MRRKLAFNEGRLTVNEVHIIDDFENVPPFLPFSLEKPLYKGLDPREGCWFVPPISLPFSLPYPHAALTFCHAFSRSAISSMLDGSSLLEALRKNRTF